MPPYLPKHVSFSQTDIRQFLGGFNFDVPVAPSVPEPKPSAKNLKLGPLAIHRLDMKKLNWFFRPKSDEKDPNRFHITSIIDTYNKSGAIPNEDAQYKRLLIRRVPWSQSFRLTVYRSEISYNRKVTRLLEELGAEGLTEETRSRELFFLDRNSKTPAQRVIYVLSSSQAWRVLTPYNDTVFPIRTAQYLLDSSKIEHTRQRHIVGQQYSSTTLFRNSAIFFAGEQLDKLVTLFRAPFRKTGSAKTGVQRASVLDRPPFSKRKAAPNMTIGVGHVKVHRSLALPDLIRTAALLESVYKGRTSDTKDPGFDFLDLHRRVRRSEAIALDRVLALQLRDATRQPIELPLDLYYRHYQYFVNPTGVELISKGVPIHKWDHRPTIQDIVLVLKQLIQIRRQIKDNAFVQLLDGLEIHFRHGGRKYKDQLLNFVHGEVTDSAGKKFFKIDGKWFEISSDYIRLTHGDFQKLLTESLIEKGPGRLDKAWKGNFKKGALTQTFLAKALEVSSGDAKTLIAELAKRNIVEGKTKRLKRGWAKAFSDASPDSDLMAEHRDDLLPILKDRDAHMKWVETEGHYNERYSNEPHTYVGDRIEPENLELWDIMRVDPKTQTLYLYHVKEKFGQSTRDACSQIVNAAVAVRRALMSNSDRDILRSYYDDVVNYTGSTAYRVVEKTRLTNMGYPAFRKIFEDNKIEFVYAFLDTHVVEASLAEERDRDLETTRTRFSSNIARLELLRTHRRVVGSLRMGLKIVQIPRDAYTSDYVEADTDAPPPTQPISTSAVIAPGDDADVPDVDPVDFLNHTLYRLHNADDPTGLRNFGNTCYLNASLQLLSRSRLFGQNDPGDDALAFDRVGVQTVLGSIGYAIGRQHDAAEALGHLLDKLEPNNSLLPLSKHITGAFASVDRASPLNIMPLAISAPAGGDLKGPIPFQGLIDGFFAPESLDGDNQYSHATLGKVDATIQYVLTDAPQTLIINLKRYIFDGVRTEKDSTRVQIPGTVTLPVPVPDDAEDDAPAPTYHISAIVKHRGNSPNSGHYIAYLPLDEGWVELDDSTPSDVTLTGSLKRDLEANGYLFLFRLVADDDDDAQVLSSDDEATEVDSSSESETDDDSSEDIDDPILDLLNTGTEKQLQKLNGVGKSKATAIVTYRTTHGDFDSVDNLTQVPKIGKSILAKVKSTTL